LISPFPSDQPETLARGILKILSDREKAKRMGEAGRKKFEYLDEKT